MGSGGCSFSWFRERGTERQRDRETEVVRERRERVGENEREPKQKRKRCGSGLTCSHRGKFDGFNISFCVTELLAFVMPRHTCGVAFGQGIICAIIK